MDMIGNNKYPKFVSSGFTMQLISIVTSTQISILKQIIFYIFFFVFRKNSKYQMDCGQYTKYIQAANINIALPSVAQLILIIKLTFGVFCMFVQKLKDANKEKKLWYLTPTYNTCVQRSLV